MCTTTREDGDGNRWVSSGSATPGDVWTMYETDVLHIEISDDGLVFGDGTVGIHCAVWGGSDTTQMDVDFDDFIFVNLTAAVSAWELY